ncbi:Lipoprotein signal peptidase [Arsenophonus endosymbiont of Aleurodicus dispersus]|uniref:signal peptidase II n=1 Tax=Arsenophonus endosymbiont of Aleurodicus dispersus TaxID=235559 RepID=UPI000EB3AC3B|nr:signal peptidase II [Arsenophonus endosymbiont of Aleurodicus dispersus]VAY02156.1 Lipoprotein signal peptidase [Arsenophonus endosymbiont of Aleurodicus dispersus]
MKNLICSTGLRWLWLTIIILIADLSSKQFISNNFQLCESIPLIPYFNLVFAKNSGAAFSFLADKGGWQRGLFAFLAIVIFVVFIVIMYRQSVNKKLSNIAYALVIGGALGNLFDRLLYGFVVDFIDFYVGDWHWPIFNIADMAICIGAALIIFDSFINTDKKTNRS